MKKIIQVTLNDYVHGTLDGATIPEAIAFLQQLAVTWGEHSGCEHLQLDWDGDGLRLIGNRLETDDEEQDRLKKEAIQRDSELRYLARLKAKYEGKS